MGRVAIVVLVGSLAGLVLVSASGRASLYSPDDPRFIISVGADGKAQALGYEEFKRRLATLLNEADSRKKANGKENSDRLAILNRIEQAQTKKLSPIETTAFAADLLRAGRVDEALNRIKPVVDRSPSYFAYTTLAHVYSARGDWREAVENQLDAIDVKAPVGLKGLTKEQCDWIAKLDRDYVLPYYKLRLRESTAKPKQNPIEEDVYPLFPAPERGKPQDSIRFVNDGGEYQPGVLAATERAKLPPDAIAVVQQLMLWFPSDTRIFWLLAELYAADGQFRPRAKSWTTPFPRRDNTAIASCSSNTARRFERLTMPTRKSPRRMTCHSFSLRRVSSLLPRPGRNPSA